MSKNHTLEISRHTELFDAQSELKKVWEKNEELYNNRYEKKRWQKLKKKRRSKVFVPTIQNTIDIIESIFSTAFFSAGCPIELLSDDTDLKRNLNLVVKHYYDKYKPSSELTKAFRSALLFKMGITTCYWDNQKKRVVTRQVPVTDLAFDNDCSGIDDIEDHGFKSVESVRIIKRKIKNKIYNQVNLKSKLNLDDENNTKRFTRKHYYFLTAKGKLQEKIYIKDILVSEKILKHNPFQYGYALNELASVFSEKREKQILCYGGDLVKKVENISEELNQKRNLKNDIQEKNLNPDVFVGDDIKIDPKDLTYGHGKAIRFKGKLSEIKDRTVPGSYELTQDTQLLRNDLRDASGVNSIQEGQTGSSDRRSQKALSVVNANSSMRIQQMINLINETLFEHWAKTWVSLVLKNADDETINKITKKTNPFGARGNRIDIEYEIKINFGTTVEKEATISDLVNVLQMIVPDQRITASIKEKILKKFLNLRLGDDTDLEDIFEDMQTNPISEEDTVKDEAQKTVDASML